MVETLAQKGARGGQVAGLALELAVLVEQRGQCIEVGHHGLADGDRGHGAVG
ncbi:hypothetical protein [Variovorax sp. UC122_21]|uniref:hypothetical protein n=1 Tax=Variovorax sp. UC122_21 TaxID=3374554 RepID=UPI0037567153